MKWELDALRILARNETVPGIALRDAISEIDRLSRMLERHPRAAKLMAKKKNFLVVAEGEPFFKQVYELIRDSEMQKGTWTQEDQWHYLDAVYPPSEERK